MLLTAAGRPARMTYAQVKDDISLSSFKIVATEGRTLTSNPPVTPVGPLDSCRATRALALMNEVEPFVSITRTYLQMTIQRAACRLFILKIAGRTFGRRPNRESERDTGLLTAAEVLTLYTRISRLARIAGSYVRI